MLSKDIIEIIRREVEKCKFEDVLDDIRNRGGLTQNYMHEYTLYSKNLIKKYIYYSDSRTMTFYRYIDGGVEFSLYYNADDDFYNINCGGKYYQGIQKDEAYRLISSNVNFETSATFYTIKKLGNVCN